MKLGIVVEYNPFHNGHLYQIKKIKEKFGENISIIIVMSGDFVQRGEMSYLDKWEKTEIALEYGIDLIVELPLYYSIQNAETFSRMAVNLLDYLEVDIQVFGAEEENINKIYEIIELQKTEEYNNKILEQLKSGHNYTISQKTVLEKHGFEKFVKSNNILGIEYVRAIKNDKLKIKPYIIKREISDYNELKVGNRQESIASASFIRKNKNKLNEIKQFVPEKVFEIIQKKQITENNEAENYETETGKIIENEKNDKASKKSNSIKEKLFFILKYKILTTSKENIIEIYDVTEELYARMYNGLVAFNNYDLFIENIKSRNFSTKRIERVILNILLDIKKEIIDFKVDYIRILGFNEKGRQILRQLKKNKEDNENEIEKETEIEIEIKTKAKVKTEKKNIFVNWKDIEKIENTKNSKEKSIIGEKIKIEKNGFLIKEMVLGKKERLNPIVKE